MKTILEFFNTLKEPYRTQAIAAYAYSSRPDDIAVRTAACLSDALYSFPWTKAEEGAKYWVKIHHAIEMGVGAETYLRNKFIFLDEKPGSLSFSVIAVQMRLAEELNYDWRHIMILGISSKPTVLLKNLVFLVLNHDEFSSTHSGVAITSKPSRKRSVCGAIVYDKKCIVFELLDTTRIPSKAKPILKAAIKEYRTIRKNSTT